MKLNRCYIENFGRLSDFSYDFTEGCNVICRENGWGKSTLAAFIRVMLFGFQNESRRDGFENERKRYKPWQKGIYGGELEFETAGIVYSVRRSFGTKSSEDDFALIRQDTGMLCEDFSEKIGEELFQIDGEGFSRTVFLPRMTVRRKLQAASMLKSAIWQKIRMISTTLRVQISGLGIC